MGSHEQFFSIIQAKKGILTSHVKTFETEVTSESFCITGRKYNVLRNIIGMLAAYIIMICSVTKNLNLCWRWHARGRPPASGGRCGALTGNLASSSWQTCQCSRRVGRESDESRRGASALRNCQWTWPQTTCGAGIASSYGPRISYSWTAQLENDHYPENLKFHHDFR